MVWLDGQGHGRKIIRKLGTKKSGKTNVDRPLQIGKTYEDLCVPCEYSPRVTSAEEDFNNQVDKTIHPVDIN